MATRRYEQRLRAQSAEETRRRVLDALYDQLRETPAQPVSVDRIARTAGVARSTVYVIFGSRAGLFDAFAADLLERGGFHRVLDAVADPDPRVTLRAGITGGVHTFAAYRDVFRALVSMAELDPDAVGGAMQRSEERRAKGMCGLARRLAVHGLLRGGLTATAGRRPAVGPDQLRRLRPALQRARPVRERGRGHPRRPGRARRARVSRSWRSGRRLTISAT